jgi:hypothetical protein
VKNPNEVTKRFGQSILGAVLVTASCAIGCGSADADSSAENEGTVEEAEFGLHAWGGVPLLPWKGSPPQSNQETSNQPGLNVAYAISIGYVDDDNTGIRTISGLNVCWYTPSRANNTYTTGDPVGCTIVGQNQAETWVTQQCAANEVVSGYRFGNARQGKGFGKFSTRCRSLTNANSVRTFPFVGDSGVLFSETLDCTTHLGRTAYVEFFNANPNFNGFNGSCVLP